MRIRKEIRSWNWNAFFKSFAIIAVFYSVFLILDLMSGNGIQIFSWLNVILYPVIISSTYANNMRSTRLFVNDHGRIADFKHQLLEKLTKEGYALAPGTDTTVAIPTGGFRKFSHRWFGTEQITIVWGDEIVISGYTRPISWIEDVLTWNPAFRYSLATN